MKRKLIIILIIIMFFENVYGTDNLMYRAYAMERNRIRQSSNTMAYPNINANGAVLIEQETSKILFEKNGNSRMYPASTTKILTALIAIENGDLDETITVGDEIGLMDPDGSRAWLRVGERMKLSDLIMGLMLPSGNDAAYTIALNIGRKIANDTSLNRDEAIKIFVDKMNERAKEIGASNSNFVNPHGIHDNNHYSTPYDMALIAREALKYDFFRQAVRNYIYEGISTNNQVHRWENTNKLLDKESSSYYKYATGIKTGHTTPAGYCLVSSASRDNMDIIAVVLNTSKENQFKDSIALLDYGLNAFTHYEIIKKGDNIRSINVSNKLPWDDLALNIIASDNLKGVFNKEDIPDIKFDIEWNDKLVKVDEKDSESIKILSSLKKGELLGRAIYTLNGENIGEVNIESGRDIKKRYLIFYFPGMMFLYENRYVTLPIAALMIVLTLRRAEIKARKRKRTTRIGR